MKNEIAKGLIYAGILLQFFPFFISFNESISKAVHMGLVGVSAIGILLLFLGDNSSNTGKKRELSDTEYMSITKEEIEQMNS